MDRSPLRKGIVAVLQTPFDPQGNIDFGGVDRLIEAAIAGAVAGFLTPAVASEVEFLTADERRELVSFAVQRVRRRVPLIVGCSAETPERCHEFADFATEIGADACLIAVPQTMYESREQIPHFFRTAVSALTIPLLIQDLQWNGPGLSMEEIGNLKSLLPTLMGIKIETVPAGRKYSDVREALGKDFYVAGGWAVPQMIEALDRGVDAMMPEASMVRVYVAIFELHAAGRRKEALALFRKLVPILAFTNQEITTSIAFFKALLVRRQLFETERMRRPGFVWDRWNRRVAEELIELYVALESDVERIMPKRTADGSVSLPSS